MSNQQNDIYNEAKEEAKMNAEDVDKEIKKDDEILEYQQDADFDMHLEAGMSYWGTNDDGDIEYVGTDKAWKKYNELVTNKLNQ